MYCIIVAKQWKYASLVKNHPLVQKITYQNPILDISKSNSDFENWVKVTKINVPFSSSQQCIYASFPCICIGKTGHVPWQPCFSTNQNNLNNFGRRWPKDHLFQIIFKSAQYFLTRSFSKIFLLVEHLSKGTTQGSFLWSLVKILIVV